MIQSSLFQRFLPIGALLAVSLFATTQLRAQAQFAGTYTGTINTKITVPVVGTIESTSGGYIATVSADGTISVAGVLTGTVSATGAVTFTGGSGLTSLGIRSATIANNQLTSNYGDVLGNGTTQFKLNGSTAFTAAAGGGTTGGGTTGGGTTGGGTTGGGTTGGGGATTGDLLVYYSFNDASNLMKDDSGRGFTLTPVGGTVTAVAGRAGGGISTNGVRLRAAVNQTFSVRAYTISFFAKVQGPGNWNPRLVAVQVPGTSTHQYGTYLNGATPGNRMFASYHLSGRAARITLSNPNGGTLPTNTTSDWQHVAVTNDGTLVTLYLNGTQVGSQNNAGAIDQFSSAMLMIGGSDNGLDLFQGQLDEIRIYNRAVTAAEVSTLSTGGSVGTAATGVNTAAAIPATVVGAPFNLTGYRTRVGQSFEFALTGAPSGAIWGTDVYTDDSNLAAAAVHAGVIAPGESKTVTVSILPGQNSYTASTRNGVTSGSWGAWTGSFSFAGSVGTTFTTAANAIAPALPSGYIAAALNVIPGGRFVMPISVTGTGPFTFQWLLNGNVIAGATANPYVVNSVTAANAGTYTVRVTSPGGTQTFNAGSLTVPANAGAPQIMLQPFDKVVSPGGTFALATAAAGNGVTYQWLRNGTVLAGETGAILLRQNVNAADAGQYTVRLTANGATVNTTASTVTLNPDASRLGNLSGRIAIAGSDRVIPAVFISGTGKKRVLIRAVGPGLAAFGVGGTMADPKFEVYDGATKISENNDWAADVAPVFSAVGAFGLPANSRDAAAVLELDAGKGYSIHVFSNTNQGGIVLFEVYDAGNVTGASKFTNVSVRGPTGTGDSTLILGLNIAGQGKRTLLTRGIGPQLASFGVTNRIADPKLEIFDNNQRSVLSNNDWNGADFVGEMLQAREFVGAFALDGGSADASTLALLDPGSYTMQITAATGTASGEALVEIYEVP